jgi:hypothetical protein
MKLDQLMQLYLRTGNLEGKTEMTLTWYTRRFGQFTRFLQARGHSMQVSELKPEDGEAYIASLMEQDERWAGHPNQKGHQGQKLSLYTIHGHANVLRALTHWACDENYLEAGVWQRPQRAHGTHRPDNPEGVVRTRTRSNGAAAALARRIMRNPSVGLVANSRSGGNPTCSRRSA